jgi:hypothetical protein
MKKNLFFSFIFFLLLSLSVEAQDFIRTKKDTIQAKVLEIGLDEIKYKDFNNLEGPVIVIAKTDVLEITYENGIKTRISPDPYDVNQEVTIRHKTHSIKFEFFSPLTNDIAFGYESMLKVGTNLEVKIAVIGPGLAQNNENASGFFFKGGVKFLKRPTFIQNGVKYSHGLNGAYIKPELIFNTFSADRNYYSGYPYYVYQKANVSFTNICMDICFGKQYILGDSFTLDYYVGVGYGLHMSSYKSQSIYNYTDDGEDYQYSHLYFGKNFPFILTGGMTIGVLF